MLPCMMYRSLLVYEAASSIFYHLDSSAGRNGTAAVAHAAKIWKMLGREGVDYRWSIHLGHKHHSSCILKALLIGPSTSGPYRIKVSAPRYIFSR